MTSTDVLLTNSQGLRKFNHPPLPLLGLIILSCLIAMTACAPANLTSPQSAWEYGDLRTLAPADSIQVDLDLIALYTRLAGSDFQVRLDLLELTPDTQADLYLALDTDPGGTDTLPFEARAEIDWDILLVIPHVGPPQAFSPPDSLSTEPVLQKNLIPRVVRYPWLDSLVVSINAASVPSTAQGFSLETFILPAGSPTPADHLGPVRTDSLPPAQADLLLAFWNSFPAYTPAQALRRWDGAHTGPFGEHHGLHVLLQNVRRYQVPVTLLDMKNPTWLSALDLVGGIPDLQSLAKDGLVILPDAVPGSPSFPYFPEGLPDWATDQAVQDSRTTATQFDLPVSQLIYAPNLPPTIPDGYALIFTASNSSGSSRWQGSRLIQIPTSGSNQAATSEGLSFDLRRDLLSNALQAGENPQEPHLLVLGGSLVDSAFGDPQASQASLLYIAAHPWMHVLRAADLVSLPPNLRVDLPFDEQGANQTTPFPPYSDSLTSMRRMNLDQPLRTAAWQAVKSLYAPLPPEPDELVGLRAVYSSQVGAMRLAAAWANSPQPLQECGADLDQDELPDCLLATTETLAVFDLFGGRLMALYHVIDGKAHQLIAPTSQFLVGQADPSTWDLTAGDAADPGGVPGAFIDGSPPWDPYYPEFSTDSLTLTNPGGSPVKTFTIIPQGLRVDYQLHAPLTTQIPLVLDPWQRFSPGWGERYLSTRLPDGWTWQIANGPQLTIRSSAPIDLHPFNESLSELQIPEDPNYEYPAGHYLVFPLALAEIQAAQDFQVEIKLSEK